MPGPLQGVTVIEMAGIGPGPFACMMLADLGATVVRIDRAHARAGDGGAAALLRNDSIVDRGRQSVALDLKNERAVRAALALVQHADILVEGFRPGVMEKFGLGPEKCLQVNPKLVYGRMTGWGQSGPLAQAAGHDINYIALSGALHAIGTREKPVPPLNLVGDYGGGGMLLAFGVLAALHHARQTGEGQVVDAAMTDGAALLMTAQYGFLSRGLWSDAREDNVLDGAAYFYGTYACADGKFVAVGAIEPAFHAEFLRLVGIDPLEFQEPWNRDAWGRLRARLEQVFRQRTRDEWCALMEGTDACVSPVLSLAEAPTHRHNLARGTFVKAHGVDQPAGAPRFDRTPLDSPASAPVNGGATRQWLRHAGLADSDIDAMVEQGIAAVSSAT